MIGTVTIDSDFLSFRNEWFQQCQFCGVMTGQVELWPLANIWPCCDVARLTLGKLWVGDR